MLDTDDDEVTNQFRSENMLLDVFQGEMRMYDTNLDEDDYDGDEADEDEGEFHNIEEEEEGLDDTSSLSKDKRKQLEQFNYKESTSDTTSSLSFLSRRITRKYASEFILPDDTRVAVSRLEGIYPMDNNEQVILSLSVGHKNIYTGQYATNDYPSTPTQPSSSNYCNNNQFSSSSLEKISTPTMNVNNKSGLNHTNTIDDNSDSLERKSQKRNSENPSESDSTQIISNISDNSVTYISRGLQIVDYLEDDLWAATILQCDNSCNSDLLRQLEAGCRLEPEAYRMERVQTVKNRETVIDFPGKPTVRTIGLSRTTSETDSIATAVTGIDLDAES
ncbi:unnamed protein product [Trichobilharzia szidati]|nr:unnamed protein product [Trichobilharzia szidati]